MTTQIRKLALLGAGALALAATSFCVRAQTPPAKEQQVATIDKPPVNEAAIPDRPLHPGDSVAAIVNDSVISSYDLRQRVALFIATSGARPNEEQKKEIQEQMLKQLETERLELLEAQKNKISVSAEEVDKSIDNILEGNHITKEQLESVLAQYGVAMATLRTQIATQIAWSKTIENQYGDQIKVSETNVNAELARVAASANKPHFHVAEIFLAVDTPEQDSKVLKDAENLESQLRQGAQFANIARQFSQTPTAAQGGDLGWIVQGQMPTPELNAALDKLKPQQVSPPIRSAGGYYILALIEREEGAGTKVAPVKQSTAPEGTLPLVRILLPIGPKPPPKLLKNAMEAGQAMREHIRSCEGLKQIVARITGAQYFDLGNMKLADMSTAMKTAVTQAAPGEAAAPFLSPAGVEIIVRCDAPPPRVVAFHVPSREEVEQQLFTEQVAVFARRYLRDLRRDADIETR